MAKNLWQKERSGLLRDLVREYIDDGYEYKEAKKLATEAGGDVLQAHKYLCWFVLVGWSIYPFS